MKYFCAIISIVIFILAVNEAAPTSNKNSEGTHGDDVEASAASPISRNNDSSEALDDSENSTHKTDPNVNKSTVSDKDEQDQPNKKHHLVKRNRTPIRYHKRNDERQD